MSSKLLIAKLIIGFRVKVKRYQNSINISNVILSQIHLESVLKV